MRFLTVLFSLCFTLSAYAQTEVILGTETSTSENQVVRGYYNTSRYQYIYTAEELGVATGTIDKISFYVGSYTGSDVAIDNITVALRHYAPENFTNGTFESTPTDWNTPGEWTRVLDDATISFNNNTGWIEFTFANSFDYNSANGNLLIDILSLDGSYGDNARPHFRYTDLGSGEASYKAISKYTDSGISSPSLLDSGTRNNDRVNTKFNFTALTYPLTISGLVETPYTSSSSKGGVSFTTSGGDGGPYTYSWSDDASVLTSTRTGLQAGTYTVAINDNGATVPELVVNISINQKIIWESLVGLEENGTNVLQKESGLSTSETNSYATSTNVMTGVGTLWYIEPAAASDLFIVGLSTTQHTIAGDYDAMDYGIEKYSNVSTWLEGSVWSLESIASYVDPGDKIEFSRDASNVLTLKVYDVADNFTTVNYTKTTNGVVGDLFVEASIKTADGVIPELNVDFGAPILMTATGVVVDAVYLETNGGSITATGVDAPSGTYKFDWDNVVGQDDGAVNGDLTEGSYTLTVIDGVDVNMVSDPIVFNVKEVYDLHTNTSGINQIGGLVMEKESGDDGWFTMNHQVSNNEELIFHLVNANDPFSVGFSSINNVFTTQQGFEIGWDVNSTVARVYENGSIVATVGNINPNDEFRISRIGNDVHLLHEGALIYTSTVISSGASCFIEGGIGNDLDKTPAFTIQDVGLVVISSLAFNADLTGDISITVLGGTPPYSYSWSDPLLTSGYETNIPTGTYVVSITDNGGNVAPDLSFAISTTIEWDFKDNLTENGVSGLLKTTSAGNNSYSNANSWAISKNQLVGEGSVTFTIPANSDHFMIGFSTTEHEIEADGYYNYRAMDYGFEYYASSWWVEGSAISWKLLSGIGAGDILRIARKNEGGQGKIYWYSVDPITGVETDLYNSNVDINILQTLYIEASIDDGNGIIPDLDVDFRFYDDLEGAFTIGHDAASDFHSISEAIESIRGTQITDDLTFLIKDGEYFEKFNFDENIDCKREAEDAIILFMPENFEDPDVRLTGDYPLINIADKKGVAILGLELDGTGSAEAVHLNNADLVNLTSLYIHGNNATGSTAIKVTNGSDISINEVFVNNTIENGIDVNGHSGTLQINGGSFNGNGIGLNAVNNSLIEVKDANYTNNSSSIEATGSTDNLFVENCVFDGITGNVLTISNGVDLEAKGMTITNSNAGNVTIDNMSGNVIVSESNLEVGSGDALSITNMNSTSKIDLLYNKISSPNTSVVLTSLSDQSVTIWNNNISSSSNGVSITTADNSNTVSIIGNLIEVNDGGLITSSVTATQDIRSNTIVVDNSTSSKGISITDGDNITLCANNVVSITSADVVYFSGANPTTMTTSFNNWHSSIGSMYSNQESIITSTSDLSVDPMFEVLDINDDNTDNYHLSPQSQLKNIDITCFDDLSQRDLLGSSRDENFFDIGAIEDAITPRDGIYLTFNIENGVTFGPGVSGYPTFDIVGLDNYSNIVLNIYPEFESGTGTTVVYHTTSKTQDWDGIDQSTSELAKEGYYAYVLDLDGRVINGLIYLKH